MAGPAHRHPGVTRLQGEPLACYRQWAGSAADGDALLLVEFDSASYWLDGAPERKLTAAYCHAGGRLRMAVAEAGMAIDGRSPQAQFQSWADRTGCAVIAAGDALELLPVPVAKPWGRELWYSAVEVRGVCRAACGGGDTPLPWLQAVLPGMPLGPAGTPPLLLKRLQPVAEPVVGELYFEVHERKHEVYVVTRVDPDAWPDGVGAVRLGFDPGRLAGSRSEADFRAAYLAAVRAYEAVRRQLDGRPGPPPALHEQEARLRGEMDAFVGRRPLRVGDVVVVPPRVPHGLLHGVEVVEFQDPVYERSILSFAGQVATQAHWDSAGAVPRMRLQAPPPELPEPLLTGPGVALERIAVTRAFEVLRVDIAADAALAAGPWPAYTLAYVNSGSLHLSGRRYRSGSALLLPGRWRGALGPAADPGGLQLLLARPLPEAAAAGRGGS